ncbi:MAG: tRNA dihydrouridine synthase DusB [Planctomycetes bacterium]|nr:tRNA dihydrouridine synthase DusB [Planctomycetota bacterium]
MSAVNRAVPLAAPGEFPPLCLGALAVYPPVVLAPMAGVTNSPFRRLCRGFGPGLFVSEMITARGFIEGNWKTHLLASFAPDEAPRSIQLYGTDARCLGEAARQLVADGGIEHIDLNFGCPVRKVTAHGGGAAIPLRPRLMASLVAAAVAGARGVPVTVKFRKGIDDEHLTYLSAGRVAQEEGAAAVGLHARTAAQLYDGAADWDAIADLKAKVAIPVLGNGDVFEAHDALRMMRQCGCDGVIIGRGCLGRPWLFRDLARAFSGQEPPDPPCLGEVADVAILHAHALCAFFGEEIGVRHMRRHGPWYTKGFPGTAALRARLNRTASLDELADLLGALPRDVPFPVAAVRARRAKGSGTQRVALPPGLLEAEQGG